MGPRAKDSAGDREMQIPQTSLLGIAINHFDKIYESQTPVVVDDEESAPNTPVIDL